MNGVALQDRPAPLLIVIVPDPMPVTPGAVVPDVELAAPVMVAPSLPKSTRVSQEGGDVPPNGPVTLDAVPLTVPVTLITGEVDEADACRNLSSSVPASTSLDAATHSAPERVTVTRV